jgi:hypothetical protein
MSEGTDRELMLALDALLGSASQLETEEDEDEVETAQRAINW